jgi:hypothetical protein
MALIDHIREENASVINGIHLRCKGSTNGRRTKTRQVEYCLIVKAAAVRVDLFTEMVFFGISRATVSTLRVCFSFSWLRVGWASSRPSPRAASRLRRQLMKGPAPTALDDRHMNGVIATDVRWVSRAVHETVEPVGRVSESGGHIGTHRCKHHQLYVATANLKISRSSVNIQSRNRSGFNCTALPPQFAVALPFFQWRAPHRVYDIINRPFTSTFPATRSRSMQID